MKKIFVVTEGQSETNSKDSYVTTMFDFYRLPIDVPGVADAESVKHHDKTESEVHGFVLFKEQGGNNSVDSVKKAVKERTVFEKKSRRFSSIVKM